jgi:hypothetical protein
MFANVMCDKNSCKCKMHRLASRDKAFTSLFAITMIDDTGMNNVKHNSCWFKIKNLNGFLFGVFIDIFTSLIFVFSLSFFSGLTFECICKKYNYLRDVLVRYPENNHLPLNNYLHAFIIHVINCIVHTNYSLLYNIILDPLLLNITYIFLQQ